MARRLPSLNALRAFEAASRHESLTLAAAELNVAHAAISRHVRELEAWLGAKLFHRTGRGVTLTDEGRALAADLSSAFDQLAAAIDRFEKPAGRKSLVVSSDVSFAALWLVPRIKNFLVKHPDIDLVIDPGPRLVDFAKGEADLAVRFGGGSWPGIASELLFDGRDTPVCSAKFLAGASVRGPADLLKHTLIREDRQDDWPAWFTAAGMEVPPNLNGPQVKGELVMAAAEAGAGFALADIVQAGDAWLSGRLVQPFDIWLPRHSYFLVHADGARLSKPAQAFRGWLLSERDRFVADLARWRKRTVGRPPAGRGSARKLS